MSRRASKSAEKAESAKEVLDQVPDEAVEDLVEDAGDQVPDEAAPEVPAAAASSKSKGIFAPKPDKALHRPIPNKPSFDWTKKGKTLVPNIDKDKGEEITEEIERDGLKLVRTNRAKWIFLCTASEYENVHGCLPSRAMFEEAFPHAFKD